MACNKSLPTSAAALTLFLSILMLAGSGLAQDKLLYTFTGGNDGAVPQSGVVFDKAGNLYGVTPEGGAYGYGVVYQLSPQPDGSWTQSLIHSFTGGSDGGSPIGGLSFDHAGDLYGVAGSAIFEFTPNGNGGWTEQVLYNFGPYNAAVGVVFDNAGHYFGATFGGGNSAAGTIFELANSGGNWAQTTLYSFLGDSDGNHPEAGLTLGNNGTFYGTTVWGGKTGCEGLRGCGTVFQMTPNPDGSWTHTVLHVFTGGDGHAPQAQLILDSAGNLYGTTVSGGAGRKRCSGGCGTVFELTPTQSGTWNETVLYRFRGGADGEFPFAALTLDSSGNLYGTTYSGGADGNGTVFKLTPNGSGKCWKTVLYSFAGGLGNDGANPLAGLTFDANGNLYGTTSGGLGYGDVFELPAKH